MADSNKALMFGVSVILLAIGVVIGMTALAGQAPTVAGLVDTSTGTLLANAGITSTTLAGAVYGFVNVLYALAVLALPIIAFAALIARQKGFI